MIYALIRLTRPYYSLPLSCGLAVITAYVVGGDFSIVGMKLIFAVISLYLVISGGYTLNDVCDRTVDAVNRPDRVLPKQIISPKAACIAAVILFTGGLIVSLTCGWTFFCVLATVTAGLILYDLYSKKMGTFKNILAAALTVSLYPLSFALAEPVPTPRLNSLFIFPVWLFLTTVGYEMLKDINDVKGDSLYQISHLVFMFAAGKGNPAGVCGCFPYYRRFTGGFVGFRSLNRFSNTFGSVLSLGNRLHKSSLFSMHNGSSALLLKVSVSVQSFFIRQPHRGRSNHWDMCVQIFSSGSSSTFPSFSGVRSQGQTLPRASIKRW